MTDDKPTSDFPFDFEALRRFYAGESDSAERETVRMWGEESARNAAILEALAPGARDLSPASQWNAQQAYKKIMARLSVRTPLHEPTAAESTSIPASALGSVSASPPMPTPAYRGWSGGYRYLAAAAMIVGAAFFGYEMSQSRKHSLHSTSAFAEAMTTRNGERAELTLRDGTRVTLAPGTTLRFTETYGDGQREIELDGEAVFTVVANQKSPFIVRTPQTKVTVLGTTFSVRGYADDTESRVVVASGKVRVGDTEVLNAGSAVTVGQFGGMQLERHVDTDAELAWMNGNLVFEDAPVSAVLDRLSRWYGVTFQLNDSVLAKTHVKVGFSQTDIQQTLNILTTVLGVDASRSGRVVTLRSRRVP